MTVYTVESGEKSGKVFELCLSSPQSNQKNLHTKTVEIVENGVII